MFIIGKTTPEKEQLVRVAKECLEIGMEAAKPYSFVGDIAMYTDAEDIPLWQVLKNLGEKEQSKECSLNYKKCSADELHNFFAEVLPAYDRDRVHDSDIKKLIQWYNILVSNGITDFEAVLAPTEGDNVDDRQEAE
jgi:dephospho-CoA kinase